MKLNESDRSALGVPQGVYRVRAGFVWKLFLAFTALLFAGIAVISLLVMPELSSALICSVPMLLFTAALFKMFRDAIAARNDELQMFEHGFIYRSGEKLQSCLWEEVSEIRRHARSRELLWVEKSDGETIIFPDESLPETNRIAEAIDAFILDPKNKSNTGDDGWGEYRMEISKSD